MKGVRKVRTSSRTDWDNFDRETPAPPPPLVVQPTLPPPPRRVLTARQRTTEQCIWTERNPRHRDEAPEAYERRFLDHIDQRELELGRQDAAKEAYATQRTQRSQQSAHGTAVAPIDSQKFTAYFAAEKAISSEQVFAEPSESLLDTAKSAVEKFFTSH